MHSGRNISGLNRKHKGKLFCVINKMKCLELRAELADISQTNDFIP